MPVPKRTNRKRPGPSKSRGRKPWKKKTPVEVVLEQADKLKAEIAEGKRRSESQAAAAREVRAGQEAVRGDIEPWTVAR